MSAAFVFLDRDGTLIEDFGYPHRSDQCVLLSGVIEGLRQLQEAGFGLAIVTNQSGIGRGYFSEAQYERFQSQLIERLSAGGVRIARSYHCPHRPDEGCSCRKPEPGLLLRAQAELDADLERSWVVGDAESDAELARRAGCRAVLIGSEGNATAAEGSDRTWVPDLRAAARWIRARSRPGS